MKQEEIEKKRQEDITEVFKKMKTAVKEFNNSTWEDFNELEVMSPIRDSLSLILKKVKRKSKGGKK